MSVQGRPLDKTSRRTVLRIKKSQSWRDEAWKNGLLALKCFWLREGHCRVPVRHVELGFKLGQWVTVQRVQRKDLPPARRRQLEVLKFVWNTFGAAWDEKIDALKEFKRREHHCLVPKQHEEGGVKLGIWVANQRRRKSTLSAERRNQLKVIGSDSPGAC